MNFDKKNRSLSNEQLAAIYAKAKSQGISSKQLDSLKQLTTLNDEIIEIRNREKITSIDAIDPALKKLVAERKLIAKPRTVKEIVQRTARTNGITEEQAKRDLTSSNVIPPGISDDAVIGASQEEQFNQIKKKIMEKRVHQADRELIEEGIIKERKGTVLDRKAQEKLIAKAKKSVDIKKFQELQGRLKNAQDSQKIQDKINITQEKLNKQNQAVIDEKIRVIKELRKAKQPTVINGRPVHGKGEPAVKGRTLGVDPFAVDVKEAKDTQFQLQKKEFELRQMGFSPALAHARAKQILAR